MPARRQQEPIYVTDRGDADWLQKLLMRAVSENWCIANYCTTCGSFQMRIALGWAERGPDQRLQRRDLTDDEIATILVGLRHCHPVIDRQFDFEQAVRWVLLRIWNQFGDVAHDRLFPRLEGSWSEEVLNSMRRHYLAKLERRRLHDVRQGVKLRDWTE